MHYEVKFVQVQVQDVNNNCPAVTPMNISLEPVPALQEELLFYINKTDADVNQNGEVYFAAFFSYTL